MIDSKAKNGRDVPVRLLPIFFVMTYMITWISTGVYIFLPDQAIALFGEISATHPVYFLATWSPAISAFVLIVASNGISGAGKFVSRLFLWRCQIRWVVFIALGIPVVFMIGSLIKGGPLLATALEEDVSTLLAILFIMLFLGPMEEFGWRGMAQPLLQRFMVPFWAGITIGVIWAVWHLPAFYLSGTVHEGWSFAPFFVGNVTLALLVTPIFNSSRGSLLWPVLFHWQLINPFWPDAQPFDTYLLVVIAIPIVWLNRKSLFSIESGVTEVIPQGRGNK